MAKTTSAERMRTHRASQAAAARTFAKKFHDELVRAHDMAHAAETQLMKPQPKAAKSAVREVRLLIWNLGEEWREKNGL